VTAATSGFYYRRLAAAGDDAVFAATDRTRSNWTPEIQHGSPPLALLTKSVEEMLPPGMRIGRLTLDILGAVPVAEIAVRTWVQRPGRRICLLAAEMAEGNGSRPVCRMTAWALATSDTADVAADRYPPLREDPAGPLPPDWRGGYLDTVRFRPQQRHSAGARVFWVSPLAGLVDDEPTTALQRLTMVVDTANGVGAVLDPRRFVYMNTETTVHLHRAPRGSDFALRARCSVGPDGIGTTTAEIFDADGFVGTSAQLVLVTRR